LPAVEPRPEPIALLDVPPELPDVPEREADEDELVEARSENRLLVPRVAPRLAAVVLDPPAADDEVLLAVFDEVTVEAAEVELPVEVEVDVGVVELGELANILAEADIAPREDPLLPLKLLRLPRSWGAITAANRSALIEPVTRRVRCRSPTATAAVRTAVAVGPPPSLGDKRSRFRYRPAAAATKSAARPNHSPRGRGLGGTGLTISGRDGARSGRAPPNGFGTEALLIWNSMSLVHTWVR